MKKRIFAASMASVMALSSVSVVAFADETKADYGEAVTKAELKEYVKSFDSFLKADVYEYGTTQADYFQGAIDYAENVIADADADEATCTAAYQMLKSVYDSLEQHTAEELQCLIDEYKKIKDTENILNEDLNDLIYPQAKFDAFLDAYDAAESYVNSDDGRLITDAYIDLENARKDLKELDSVTKKDFRAALKDFELIAKKFQDYESWRRGKVSVNPETGTNFTDTNASKKKLSDAFYVTFEELYDVVYDSSSRELVKDKDGDYLKDNALTWIETDGSTVREFVNTQYKKFDAIQSSAKTTNEDIVNAYKAAKEAVAVFKSWKADDTNRAAKGNINSLINNYRAKLVRDYCSTTMTGKIKAAYSDLPAYVAGSTEWKTTAEVTLILDKNTKLIALDTTGDIITTADPNKHTEQKVAKDQNIMKYIPVLASEVAAYTDIAGAKKFADKVSAYQTALGEYSHKLEDLKNAKDSIPGVPNGTAGSAVNLTAITNPDDGTKEDFAADNTTIESYSSSSDTTAETAYNNAVTAYKDAHTAAAKAANAANAAKSDIPSTAPTDRALDGVDLANLLAIVEKYNMADETTDKTDKAAAYKAAYDSITNYVGLDYYDENNIVAVPGGSRNEYTLLNRKLTYVLADLYPAEEEAAKYTKKDVDKLIDAAYDLCEKTGDSEVFSVQHMHVVDARKNAIKWLTAANATKGYKEGDVVDDETATSVYNDLNDKIKALQKEFDAYPISYGEIAGFIAEVAADIDNGVYAKADAIKAGLATLASKLSTLEATESENQAFTDDREFVIYNRLLVSKNNNNDEPNESEKALKSAYDALLKAIEDDAKPEDPTEVVLGDLDGDDVATAKDALLVLKGSAQAIELTDAQKKAADFDKDGEITAKDALAILKAASQG